MKKLVFTIVAMLVFTISISAYMQRMTLSSSGIYQFPTDPSAYLTYPMYLGQEIEIEVAGAAAGWSYYVGPEIKATKLSDTRIRVKYEKKGYPGGCAMHFGNGDTTLWIYFKE